ncbi:MAG TPA: hypothetical protein VMU75_04010 [Acidimicrobiales bacterium]|nr:hypothetical protein [Acidimicrobiales bacterium]
MNSPLYAVVTALHVLAAVVGFGALGATGTYAHAARLASSPASVASLGRFFRPGRNWAARTILVVPVLGGLLLALGHGQDAGRLFPWLGLGIWTAAVGVASGAMWPAEREIQRALAPGAGGDAGRALPGGRPAFERACARCERAAAVTSLLFVAALFVMIAQPG